jgi:hypothetical protein
MIVIISKESKKMEPTCKLINLSNPKNQEPGCLYLITIISQNEIFRSVIMPCDSSYHLQLRD